MKNVAFASEKIHTLTEMRGIMAGWRLKGKTIALINGDFDNLHAGHISTINVAAKNADYLLVAIRSDVNISINHPEKSFTNKELDRALILANFTFVDAVILYDEKDISTVVETLQPDILVRANKKGVADMDGTAAVQAYGGQVIINDDSVHTAPIQPQHYTGGIKPEDLNAK